MENPSFGDVYIFQKKRWISIAVLLYPRHSITFWGWEHGTQILRWGGDCRPLHHPLTFGDWIPRVTGGFIFWHFWLNPSFPPVFRSLGRLGRIKPSCSTPAACTTVSMPWENTSFTQTQHFTKNFRYRKWRYLLKLIAGKFFGDGDSLT